jgi:Kef-type K+ transport system membrane component KefB
MEFGSVFTQMAAVLTVCALLAGLALLVRLPLILGLIAAGIVVGPEVLGLVEASEEIELLAAIGIAVLLFVVGLKLDVRVVRRLGAVALAAGIGQIVLAVVLAFAIAIAFGFEPIAAGYLAMAMAFSSTIIVVKLLSDRRELKVLHGRIAIGILIVQDIVVVLTMIGLSGFDGGADAIIVQLAGVVLRGVILLVGLALLTRFVLPRAIHLFARQAELLVLAAVAWAVLLASASVALGFTEEVGAFLAGVSLASSPYRDAISGRLTALRDFLLVFFFIELGTTVDLSLALGRPGPALALIALVLIGKPLIVIALTGWLGYRSRTTFQAGLTLGQISEFSLILVALGVSLGHVGDDVMGIVTAVALVTIAVSTLLVNRSDQLFRRLHPVADVFERDRTPRDLVDRMDHRPHAILLGLGRFGSALYDQLVARGIDVLGIDFDPRNRLAVAPHAITVFGDAEDPELPSHLPLDGVDWIISSVRDVDANLTFLSALREHGYRGRVALSADDDEDEQRLLAAGADAVVCPFRRSAGSLVSDLFDRSG